MVLGLALGCKDEPAVPAAPVRASAEPSPAASMIQGVLASVHARFSLAAPPWQLQPLCFGRHLFVQLARDRVNVFSLPDFGRVMQPELVGPRAVVALADGSLLAAGATESLRFQPGAKTPQRLPAVPWLPGTLLLPERRDPKLLWVAERHGRELVRQRLERDPTRSFDGSVTLEGHDGGPIAALRDGTLLYRTSSGVAAAFPGGRARAYRTDMTPWRLLPAHRIDEAWAVAADGAVELWQLGERLAVPLRLRAVAAPFDAAASDAYLALVVVDEPGNAPRRFRLLVFGSDGAKVLERSLPPGPPETGDDWAEAAVRNRYVALSDTDSVVAVGGPETLAAWRLPDGESVTW